MARFTICAAILLVLTCSFEVFGQSMPPTLSCDVVVNGYTVTFPKGWMPLKECRKVQAELKKKDMTGADIICICQQGSRT